ncbi:MAG: hypothetical protein ACW972_00140 [Promethearchaeota archaeon]|jgi:hypothetical protein
MSKDKDTFIINLESLGNKEPYVSNEIDFSQVYDALLKKWLSGKNHVIESEDYWKQISDEETSQHYLNQFYSIIVDEEHKSEELENSDLTAHVDFFIAPTGNLEIPSDEGCYECLDTGYIDCLECSDYDGYYCDYCDDVGYIDGCLSCNDASRSIEFLVGGVLWYNFKNPYTEEKNNAAYINQILYFGTYTFFRNGENPKTLNENDVIQDVESAYIWAEISKLPAIIKLMEDKNLVNSYYGFQENYDDLVTKIDKKISKSKLGGSTL